ncbi:TetR/AcrR family transcriptional regulator [Proteus terrae]|jgi:TetR/AcrR family transcriptional regulator, transcriptional repressor NalC|uniref:TetR/AcrR family transcriptional regulator n=1 Tax=Proteus terrae TaxID=1574161 RepID=UPI00298C73E8|nr:TetR/AcrR family transcriptional regulator [Proteus terrae]WPC98932.1 TetR/AcrR family transcriptional regulator [Proteus terrae]
MAQNAKATPLNERGKKRADAIIKAATEIFIENGYEKTSLDMIITRSGGSRSTLYAHFGDKEGLLSAVIESLINDIFSVENNQEHINTPYDVLYQFGSCFIRKMLNSSSIGLYRLIIAESANHPQLSQNFYLLGPQKVYGHLTENLRSVLPSLSEKQLFPLAQHFTEMLKTKLFFDKLYLPETVITEEQINDQVALCSRIIATYIEHELSLSKN